MTDVNVNYELPRAIDLNLDAMPPADLLAFALRCRGPIGPDGTGRASGAVSVKAARTLFPARPRGYVSATETLCHYAWNRYTAMQCRRRGDMISADIYETICDRLYQALPVWARGW